MSKSVPFKEESPTNATQSPPINATLLNRCLTLLAVKLIKRTRKRNGSVLFLSRTLCVKIRSATNLSEASTLQFVAKHTSLPVPRVYCAFVSHGRAYIVMQRIQGEYVGDGWRKRSEESKARLLHQLGTMVQEMRRIPCPEGTGVARVDGGPVYDPRMPGAVTRVGPFRTIQAFHSYLRRGVDAHPNHIAEIGRLIAQHDTLQTALVFTHGDLSSLNILASGDDIVGIVDWETAGWYPAYWEYTTAWHVNPQNEFWRDEVDKFLQPMPEELAMEKIRRKYFGDIT